MIHQFKNNGYNIVIDINSGAIHVVDELVYDFLDIWQKKGREAAFEEMKATHQDTEEAVLLQCQSEIDTLIEEGSLFTEDNYEPRIIDFTKRSSVLKARFVHISHDCNLACKYCFAEEGEYHGGKRELMSLEVGKAALDFLVANSGTRRNLEVDFFGGEPTMNWQVVKDLVAYGRSLEEANNKNFRFTLTTNGVLLNEEIQEFANKEMANVVLSCDGRPEIHNLMRPFRKGAPSYEVVMPKFKELANSRGQDKYYIRGTFTRNNLDFSKDVLHLADEGFKQISVEPVVAQETDDYALKSEDLPQLFDEYDALCAEMMRRQGTDEDFNFFHFMIDLEGGPCVYKRLSGCGSGTEYVSVTPTGEIYPCHQFVGNTEFILGDVFTGIKNTELVNEFKHCNVYAKEACRNCFARFYCSGGCAANAYNFTGSILGNYEIGCELQKKRIECAIALKVHAAELEQD